MRNTLPLPFWCLLLLPLASHAQEVNWPTAPLSIRTQQGTLPFTVEVATTDAQQQRGLMFRSFLPEKYGMIFVFPKARHIDFWMKNTVIPLDMLFVDDKGIILQIAANAKPQSTEMIPSRQDSRALIELAGGSAARLHIAPGDKVIYPLFP